MRIYLCLTIAIVAVAAGCGDSDEAGDTSTTTRAAGPTGSSESPKSSGVEQADPSERSELVPSEPPPSGGSGFDTSKIRLEFTYKTMFSKSEVALFVASGDPSSHLAQAKSCVAALLAKSPSAYCYAFPSVRSLRAARISRRAPIQMKRECWSAYWGKSKGRHPIGTGSNPAAATSGCPG
jgi:hypothetical protein